MDTTRNDSQQIDLRAIEARASDAQQSREYSPNTSRRRAITNEASAEDVPALLAALAAERDRGDRAEVELDAVTSLDADHFMDIWDSLPRVSYTTRVAMAQAAVELIKQATA